MKFEPFFYGNKNFKEIGAIQTGRNTNANAGEIDKRAGLAAEKSHTEGEELWI